MKQQIYETFPAPFEQMTETEIIAYFGRYGFSDELGHQLTMCADFLDFVRFAKRGQQPEIKPV